MDLRIDCSSECERLSNLGSDPTSLGTSHIVDPLCLTQFSQLVSRYLLLDLAPIRGPSFSLTVRNSFPIRLGPLRPQYP